MEENKERETFEEWFHGEQGTPYYGMWDFAWKAWQARATIAAPAPASPAALTDGYVQTVPDKCDRIVWRNRYWHLSENGIAAEDARASRQDDTMALEPIEGRRYWNDTPEAKAARVLHGIDPQIISPDALTEDQMRADFKAAFAGKSYSPDEIMAMLDAWRECVDHYGITACASRQGVALSDSEIIALFENTADVDIDVYPGLPESGVIAFARALLTNSATGSNEVGTVHVDTLYRNGAHEVSEPVLELTREFEAQIDAAPGVKFSLYAGLTASRASSSRAEVK